MLRYLWLSLALLCFVVSQTTDKYSDEDRPYKFGFNIQGYQHRQEEKDEKGIIKGEYGFITADGYYRVTVYATDENGDFRIISMKNYYVGFPPEDPTTTPGPSGGSRGSPLNLSFGTRPGPTGRALVGEVRSEKPEKPVKPFVRPQGLAACSDCSIPTTTVRTNAGGDLRGRLSDGRFGARGRSFGGGFPNGQGGSGGNFQGPGGSQGPQSLSPGRPESSQPRTGGLGSGGLPGGGLSQPRFGEYVSTSGGPTGSRSPAGGLTGPRSSTEEFGGPGGSFPVGSRPNQGSSFSSFDSTGRAGGTQLNQGRPRIGVVKDGLPPGVTIGDIKDLLYTFNYTVGFHGHHEDGYRNGDKLGDYFFDGRDGVERKVEYLANEFGYQPNITLIDLGENDVRRPNEQTEKEYGLKGYEFKWFYRK